MPQIIDWLIPGRLLYQRIYGDVTIEDLKALNSETNRIIIAEGIAPIHSIVDLSELGNFPKSISAYKDAFDSPDWVRDKFGWYIIVAPSPLMRLLASVAIQVAGVKMRTFPDRAASEAFLRDQDSTLQYPSSVSSPSSSNQLPS